jgi:apolipoprotein N-acyltransferase
MSIINSENLENSVPVEKTVEKKLGGFLIPAFLAILSGAFIAFAFPDFDIWFLTFIAWTPLLIALKGKSARVSLLLGTLTGFTFAAIACRWLFHTINYFGNFNAFLSILFMVIVCIYQGLREGLLALLFSRAVNKGWPVPLSFAMALISSEFLYPLLFPWHVATHVHTIPLLMQLADIGGPFLIAAFLAMTSIAIAEIFWSFKEKRPVSKAVVAAGVLSPLIMIAYGAYRISYIDGIVHNFPAGRVGIYQGNRPMLGDNPVDSLKAYRKGSWALETIDNSLDFIMWPEGGLSYGLREKEVSSFFKNSVFNANETYGNFKINTPIVTGGFVLRGDGKDLKTYNVSYLVEPNGRVGGIYEKYFLIPFGEFIPFGNIFPVLYTISPNSLRLTPGTHLSTFTFKNYTITPLICYEDIKPSFANNAITVSNPDLLVSFANDGWFGQSSVPHVHFAMSKFRAVEHRRYLARATNTGISGFVDPAGRAYETTDPVQIQDRIGEVRYMKMHTIFEALGDYPYWLISIGIILMGLIKKK